MSPFCSSKADVNGRDLKPPLDVTHYQPFLYRVWSIFYPSNESSYLASIYSSAKLPVLGGVTEEERERVFDEEGMNGKNGKGERVIQVMEVVLKLVMEGTRWDGATAGAKRQQHTTHHYN